MQPHKEIPLRKSIFAISPAERKRYFWCLKALGFLPAHSTKREYFFRGSKRGEAYDQRVVRPQTIQDELIGSHATVCEHQTIYFAHFHRHLAAVFEMELNYAQEFLLGDPKGTDFNLKYPTIYKKVTDEFKNLCKQIKETKVMAHYWNPTHYLNDGDIVPPVELLDPSFVKLHKLEKYGHYSQQSIDKLYFEVNGAYPWQFNFQQKWFQDGRKFDEQSRTKFRTNLIEQLNQGNTFFMDNQVFQQDQNVSGILTGKSNPRSSDSTEQSKFFEGFLGNYNETIEDFKLFWQLSKNTKQRSTFYFDHGYASDEHPNTTKIISNNKMRVWSLNENEVLSIFGAHSKEQHWISKQEMEVYQYDSTQKLNARNFNNNLPHYQAAYAYFNKEVNKDFLNFLTDDGNDQTKIYFESAHDCIHDFNQYFMRDGSFSLCNLLFFPYHSYIDFALELKIREIATSEYEKTKDLLENRIYPKSQYFQYLLFPEEKYSTKGQYKIMEWANPAIGDQRNKTFQQQPSDLHDFTVQKDIEYLVDFQTYCLSEKTKTVRRSHELNDVYEEFFKKQERNMKKYADFEGFKNYSFDYNYELFEYDFNQDASTGKITLLTDHNKVKTIKKVLPDESCYPKHLEIIRKDILSDEDAVEDAIKKTVDLIPKSSDKIDMLAPFINSIKKVKSLEFYTILFNEAFTIVGKYSSSLSSGLYKLCLAKGQQYQPEIFNKCKIDFDINKAFDHGIEIASLNIFSRDGTEANCSRCKKFKYFHINLNPKLMSNAPLIWQCLTSYLHSETPLRFSTDKNLPQDKASKNNSLKDWFVVKGVKKFQDVKLVEGAEKVIILTSVTAPLGAKGKIKIDATSHSIYSDEMKSIVTHSDEDLETQFNFDKIIMMGSSERDIPNDRAVFKQLRCKISIAFNGIVATANFNFDIKGYFSTVRYGIKVVAQQGNTDLAVSIYDIDYQARQDYVDSYIGIITGK